VPGLKSRGFTNRSTIRLNAIGSITRDVLDSAIVILATLGTFQTPLRTNNSENDTSGDTNVLRGPSTTNHKTRPNLMDDFVLDVAAWNEECVRIRKARGRARG